MVGHDEYYSIEMFNHLQAAIGQGLNVAFLSGNTCCGRILFSADGKGRTNRVFERVGVFGPPGGTQEFIAMKTLPHERPYANELVGAHSTGPVTGGADWTCAAPDHWLFAGTGMKRGDGIPGLVGWEWHGDPAPIPGLEILATGPTQSAPGKTNGGVYTATIYQDRKATSSSMPLPAGGPTVSRNRPVMSVQQPTPNLAVPMNAPNASHAIC
jgi:hypothetical protein